jgi:hypothetical protein
VEWFPGRGDLDSREHVDLAVAEGSTSNEGSKLVGVDALVLSEEGSKVLRKDAKVKEGEELTRERTFYCQVFRKLQWFR